MKKLNVDIQWQNTIQHVGTLSIFEVRGQERYQFIYSPTWITSRNSFVIDPELEFAIDLPYHKERLWGVFQDIAPDRWGRLVQTRVKNKYLSESDFLLGVSDYMRMGALRLSYVDQPNQYLAENHDVPKLIHLRELEEAISRLESGQQTNRDLVLLAQPGSSLGGARPKASIEDKNQLWIAKFQSNTDFERTSLWEATMLDLARNAGILTANHKLLNYNGDRPILLVERFDREGKKRIPFISAMSLLGRDETSRVGGSYIEIADLITRYSPQPKIDKAELFRRMTFNAMASNTDDHLRNHGFLRHEQGWQLSPAYDLNPSNEPFDGRYHALTFDGTDARPSLTTCLKLSRFFGLNIEEANKIIQKIGRALANWENVAKQNGLHTHEIKRLENAFIHKDSYKFFNS